MMKRWQNKRVWLGVGAVAAALIIAVAWLMFIGPQLSSTDDANSQTAATSQQNSVLKAKLATLQRKSAQLSRYTAALKNASAALPYDSGLPAFTRQLSAQAHANLVSVTGVVVGDVTAVSNTSGSTTSDTPSSPSTGTGDATTTPDSAANPSSAVAGGLFSVQITVTSNGSLAHQLAFLDDIELVGPRRALVSSTQVTAGAAAKTASITGSAIFTTQMTIFSAPQSPAQLAALKKLLSGKIGN